MSKEKEGFEFEDLSTSLQLLLKSKGNIDSCLAVDTKLTDLENRLGQVKLTIDITRPTGSNDLNVHVNENTNIIEVYHADAWHGTAVCFK